MLHVAVYVDYERILAELALSDYFVVDEALDALVTAIVTYDLQSILFVLGALDYVDFAA